MSVRKHLLATGVATVAGACLLVASAASGSSDRSASAAPAKLGKEDRALLAQARANGDATVTLLLAAKDGQNAAAVAALAGGRRDSSVPGRRRLVPARRDRNRQRRDAVNSIDAVQSADVDDDDPAAVAEPRREPAGTAAARSRPGDAEDNPYMPVGETGSVGVHARRTRPGTAAGSRSASSTPASTCTTRRSRPRAPASARSSTGSPAPIRPPTTTRPGSSATTDVGGQGRQVHGRHDDLHGADVDRGHFFWSLFNEGDSRFTGSEYGNDINRDGNPAGSSRLFGVLRDGDKVWVDTDQDLSFADETGMVEYKQEPRGRHFGTDNPATAVREIVPFVVQVAHEDVGTPAVRRRPTSTSASSPARTARTSRASSPATACSAVR